MKTFKKCYRVAIRSILIVTTFVVLLFSSLSTGKIFVTQTRLALLYQNIESAESARDQAQKQALNSGGMLATYYQNQADSWDEKVETLTQKRYSIQNSSDAVVAWAAKNGFELSIFAFSIGIILFLVGAWVLCYKNLIKVIDVEEWLFSVIVSIIFKIFAVIFKMFAVIFYFFARACLGFAQFNKRKPAAKKTNKTHKTQPNVIRLADAAKKRKLG